MLFAASALAAPVVCAALGSMGCAHSTVRAVSAVDYEVDLTRSYEQSQATCFSAVLAGVREMGFDVAREDGTRIETTRADSGVVEGLADSARGRETQMTYDFEIEGDVATCVVRVTRFRVWNRGTETRVIDIDYAREHYWWPLLQAIADQMPATAAPRRTRPTPPPDLSL